MVRATMPPIECPTMMTEVGSGSDASRIDRCGLWYKARIYAMASFRYSAWSSNVWPWKAVMSSLKSTEKKSSARLPECRAFSSCCRTS